MEAVADEIAEHTAAFGAAGLPVLEAHPRAVILDVPVDFDVAQATDSSTVDQRFRLCPAHYFAEIEIDHGHTATRFGGTDHALGSCEVGRHRLFREYRLAQLERANGDLRLQSGFDCDTD